MYPSKMSKTAVPSARSPGYSCHNELGIEPMTFHIECQTHATVPPATKQLYFFCYIRQDPVVALLESGCEDA